MQAITDLDEIKRIVDEVNMECASLAMKTVDSRGQQKMEYWLPEKLKQLMIEEFKRPDGQKTHIAIVKYFNPSGNQTWWFSELDERGDEHIADFFGLAEVFEKEYGYTNLRELREVRCRFGLFIERDYHFTPRPLSEC